MNRQVIIYPIFVSLLLVLSVLYGFTKNRNLDRNVHSIEVKFAEGDNSFLTHETVNKLLIQSEVTVKNQAKRILDLHSLEEKVLANPYVDKAKVFVTPGGLIKTHISQKEPVARIISGAQMYYVDDKGYEFPLSTNYSARVPLVKGEDLSSNIEEITKLIRFISQDDFLKKEITGIRVTNTKEYILHVRSGDYTVHFGKFDNVNVKFKKLKAFYNKSLKDKSISKYETINLKYRNQVVCTKQNQDGKQ